MSIALAVGKLLVQVVGEVLLEQGKRVLARAKARRNKPVVVPAPIGTDRFVAGFFDGIEHQRARQLELHRTELARKQLDERSDEK